MDGIPPNWLQLLRTALAQNNLLPPLETHFPFPWEDAAAALQITLDLPALTLSSPKAEWKDAASFLQGMGPAPSILTLELLPIEGPLFFVLPRTDLTTLTTAALTSERDPEGLSNPKLRQGLYRFLFLKILQTIDLLQTLKNTSLQLAEDQPLPEEGRAFCIDISIHLQTHTLHTRLICPEPTFLSLKQHLPFQEISLFSFSQTSPLPLTLSCEIGHTTLSQEEWNSIQLGDFIFLDRCSFDPQEQAGSATLHLGNTPLFVIRIKPDGLKVLDLAVYEEKQPDTSSDTLLLTAEIGHVSLELKDLLNLKPESTIPLMLRPEDGIFLTERGKRVAKAELLKLGSTTGLRLLSLHG